MKKIKILSNILASSFVFVGFFCSGVSAANKNSKYNSKLDYITDIFNDAATFQHHILEQVEDMVKKHGGKEVGKCFKNDVQTSYNRILFGKNVLTRDKKARKEGIESDISKKDLKKMIKSFVKGFKTYLKILDEFIEENESISKKFFKDKKMRDMYNNCIDISKKFVPYLEGLR